MLPGCVEAKHLQMQMESEKARPGKRLPAPFVIVPPFNTLRFYLNDGNQAIRKTPTAQAETTASA